MSSDRQQTSDDWKTMTQERTKKKKPNLKPLSVIAERFETASPTRVGCEACGLHKVKERYARPFVPGNWTKKVLVITTHYERPNTTNGRLILQYARKAGYDPIDVALMGAVRCRRTGDKKHNMTHLRACRSYIVQALTVLQPEHIVVMGNDAARAVLNIGTPGKIMENRGILYPIPGVEGRGAFLTFEPTTSTDWHKYVINDFKRLTWPITPWPNEGRPDAWVVGVDTEFDPEENLLDIAWADKHSAELQPDPSQIKYVDTIAGHSVMTEVNQLVKMGLCKEEWATGEKTLDSLLLARMTDENRGKGGYGVETLLRSSKRVNPWKFKTEEYDEKDATKWPVDLRQERCKLDAWASAVLVDQLKGKARGPVELTHRITASLHRLGLAGAYVDLEAFAGIDASTLATVNQNKDLLTRHALQAGMSEFVPTNDNHIRTLLFDKLGFDKTDKTETGLYKVDQLSLKKYKEHDVVKALLAYNKADKIYSVYVEGVRRTMKVETHPWGDIGRLAVNINPLGARTGRRSSGKNEDLDIDATNSQNWPKPFRPIIRSRWEHGLIGDHDYSRLEVLLFAWHAGEQKLFDFFYNGNGYIAVAKELWNRDVLEGTDQYRATKSTVLGVQYNMQPYKLAMQLWHQVGVKLAEDFDTHLAKAEKLHEKYLNAFPGIRRFIRRQEKELLATGGVNSKTGRRRHLHCPEGEDTPHYWHMKNEAVNFPVQSFASDVTGSALIDIEEALCAEHHMSRVEYHGRLIERRWPEFAIPFNEVHDDLVIDYYPPTRERDEAIVRECMTKVHTLRKLVPEFDIPLKVGVSITPRWGQGEK